MRTRLAAALLLLTASCSTAEPTVAFAEGTPDDFAALARDVVAMTAAALPLRASCLDGLLIEGAWELDDRARYHPGEGRMQVRIPATAAQLTASLVHELAHHLDAVCGDDELRDAFRKAQGIPAGQPWGDAETWQAVPAEQFAAAVVLLVTGRTDRGSVVVEDVALDAIRMWGSGEVPMHGPSAP